MTREEKAGLLYDFAVEHPEHTAEDAMQHFGWARREFGRVARQMRLILREDEINYVCDPNGANQPHVFRLVGRIEDAVPWQRRRLRSLESQLETVQAVSESIVHGTDGRTIEGRKARVIEKSVRHLLEDLDLLRDEQLAVG